MCCGVFKHASSLGLHLTKGTVSVTGNMTGSQLKELWDVRMHTDLIVFLSTCQDHDRPRKELGQSSGNHMPPSTFCHNAGGWGGVGMGDRLVCEGVTVIVA